MGFERTRLHEVSPQRDSWPERMQIPRAGQDHRFVWCLGCREFPEMVELGVISPRRSRTENWELKVYQVEERWNR